MRCSTRMVALVYLLAAAAVTAQEYPVRPYVDPTQLDVAWPKHSHYKQPWRSFLETRSGYDFLQGIGINFNVGENVELAARLLAEAGFAAARIEIGWGSVNWDETALNGEDQVRRRLEVCRENGIRPTVLPKLPTDARFGEVATPPLRAVQRLTRAFADSEPMTDVTQLGVDVVALSKGRKVFDGDDEHPPLWERDLVAVLPFELAPGKFLIAVYVMTYDYTKPMPEQRYRLTITGLPDEVTAKRVYDPLQDRDYPVKAVAEGEGSVVVELPVSDTVRLLDLTALQ